MARKIRKACLDCALLSVQDAQRLHGETGDGCWDPKVCHRRRSHYRHRADQNAKRRGHRAQTKAMTTTQSNRVDSIAVSATLTPVALIYLYRANRKDAHLHAIAISVWRGEAKLAEVQPVHCMGMTNRQVHQYLKQVLAVLKERYGITEFEPEIRLEPCECPIRPCPLREP